MMRTVRPICYSRLDTVVVVGLFVRLGLLTLFVFINKTGKRKKNTLKDYVSSIFSFRFVIY